MKEPMTGNAKIESTMLGLEDHGIMTAYLNLDYGGSGQGFGGYGFCQPIKDEAGKFLCRRGTAYGCEWIRRVLEVVGVEKWEDLPGKYVRVVYDWGKVYRIGNIIKDEWFSPEELGEKMKLAESSK